MKKDDIFGCGVIVGALAMCFVVIFCAMVERAPIETREMRISAYCSCEKCCGVWAKKGINSSGQRITASGYEIQEGDRFVAAPAEWAFGTVMDISGYGKVEVKDRGGSIKGNRLDVYFDTHQEALNWGVQYLSVQIERK